MKKMTKEEIKEVQIEILIKTAEFCDDNNIKYFLGYGTLLGAIRHKGFIPWDDDIDIVMLREDYEKFIDLTNGRINEEIDIFDYRNNKNYIYPFAKAIFNKTYMIENEIKPKYNLGVYIDIFPLDEFPNEDKLRSYINRMNLYKKFISFSSIKFSRKNGILKDIFRLWTFKIFSIFHPHLFINLMNRTQKNMLNNPSSFIGNSVWGYGIKEKVRKSVFSNHVEKTFEGKLFKVPIGWSEWLTTLYGDYMSLPPESERIAKHNYSVFWKE